MLFFKSLTIILNILFILIQLGIWFQWKISLGQMQNDTDSEWGYKNWYREILYAHSSQVSFIISIIFMCLEFKLRITAYGLGTLWRTWIGIARSLDLESISSNRKQTRYSTEPKSQNVTFWARRFSREDKSTFLYVPVLLKGHVPFSETLWNSDDFLLRMRDKIRKAIFSILFSLLMLMQCLHIYL